MFTVIEGKSTEIIVRRSRFISAAYHAEAPDEVSRLLAAAQIQWPKATHYVWAYILQAGDERMTDDGEPQGTAGSPTLTLLQKHSLVHTALITVRYFGGTKLGTGGLVHAYQQSAKEALAAAQFGEEQDGVSVCLKLPYGEWGPLRKLLEDFRVSPAAEFLDAVTVRFSTSTALWSQLKDVIAYEASPHSILSSCLPIQYIAPQDRLS